MAIYAEYLGPKHSQFSLMHKGQKLEFPYHQLVTVDKDVAKFLKGLVKDYTDDPKFKITADKKGEE